MAAMHPSGCGYVIQAGMPSPSPSIDAVLAALPDAVVVFDTSGTVVLVNERAEAMFGRPRDELVGHPVDALLTADVEVALRPLDAGGDRFTVAVVREPPPAGNADDLRARARQQAAVAELGQSALSGAEVEDLMQSAAHRLADVLGVDLVEVLELQPDREWFVMRGAVGWDEGPSVPVADTQVGHTLERQGPVIVRDTAVDRERGAGRLRSEYGVVSSLAVPMRVADRDVGAVGLHSRTPREFSPDDVHFAQSVANVIASALERRRADTEIEQTSSRLQAVLDASPAVIYLKDLDGKLILANRQFETLFGVTAGSAIGQENAEFVDPETAAEIRANDNAVIAAGAPLEVVETLPLEEGDRTFISLKFPLRDADGRIEGVGGVSTDVTERTQAQAQRAALEARLARAERLESVGQLAGGIAHDFNNLLAVIANYAGFLETAVEPDSQAAADVEQILVACRGANELTRRLLLFSRRRAGNPEVIDLDTVIAETQRLLQRTLGEQIELQTDIEEGLWHVLADRSQLEQVLMNLAINARDAMPDGGVLRVEASNVEVAPNAVPGVTGEAVRLTVSDTGVGMAEEVLDRAFDPFFSTKPAGEGTGLGLATVYGIVRGAGGHVDLRSTRGKGTTVTVHLPGNREPVQPAGGHEASPPPPAQGERVLLVEDKDAVRILTARILGDAGYDVRTASDGLEALERHGDGTDGVDALITDIVMPGLSGQELADELRRRRPGLPVVFVSGYTEDYVVEGARRDGATAFVEKPFAADDLLAAVRRVLEEGNAGS
jgi:PAS domain S-box-containing protein